MKTAVEWFAEQEEKLTLEFISKKISELEYGLYSLELLNKAKEMEKQRLKDAWNDGAFGCGEFTTTFENAEEYYNETFKSE